MAVYDEMGSNGARTVDAGGENDEFVEWRDGGF